MDKATDFISEHIGPFWHRGWAAFILAASLGVSAFLTAVISLGGEISWASVTSGLLSFTITAGFWLLTHHIPRTPKGKVGIIIAITSDDQNEAAQIRADFLSKLREALQQTPDTVSFHPIVLYQVWLAVVTNAFVMRRDRQFIVEKEAIAKKLLPRDPKNYQALLSLAMAEFLLHRNVAAARAHLKQCEGIENNIWHYSLAFLSGYEADLQAAHDSYRTAFRKPTTDVTVPLQCEEFIQEILRDEPHQTQLCFCSGLINYNAKPDYVAALRDFEKFHTSPSAANHPWAKDLSKRLIEQCRKKIAESR